MPDLNGDGVDDVEQVNTFLLSRGLTFLARLWRGAWGALEGVKTFTLSTALALLGLIDQFGGVDLLQSLIGRANEGDNPRIGKWLMGVMVVFIALSFLTKRSSDAAPADAVEAAPAAAGYKPPSGDDGETV